MRQFIRWALGCVPCTILSFYIDPIYSWTFIMTFVVSTKHTQAEEAELIYRVSHLFLAAFVMCMLLSSCYECVARIFRNWTGYQHQPLDDDISVPVDINEYDILENEERRITDNSDDSDIEIINAGPVQQSEPIPIPEHGDHPPNRLRTSLDRLLYHLR